ncbi:MAG: hypothetical protein ACE5NG_16520, partial [bacterium]
MKFLLLRRKLPNSWSVGCQKLLVNSILVATILSTCVPLRGLTPVPSIKEPEIQIYEIIMERLLNPVLNDEQEVLQWALEYDKLFGQIVELDTMISDQDIRLARIIQGFKPAFLYSEHHSITSGLYIAFAEDAWRNQDLATAMVRAYYEISHLFRNQIQLGSPKGFIFVLVMENPNEQLRGEKKAGFTIRASRFIVMFQAYYYQYGYRLPDYDAFYRTFKHELVHAFINAQASYS